MGEKLRQALDLEHWPAFRTSFGAICELLAEVAAGRRGEAPATITVVSGDVHHAYLAEVAFPRAAQARSHVWQAVCSPFRNPLNHNERRAMRFTWTPLGRIIARALARAARVPDPPVRWRLAHDDPWFDNQVAWLSIDGREARFGLEKAVPDEADPRLEHVFERVL
jgi:YD repeat-containing protein